MAEQCLTTYAGDPPGDPIGEATLPGRHWHELGSAFRAWGLEALADLWPRPLPGAGGDPWPFPSYADPDHLYLIRAGAK
ncbi:hypothetical protein [Actinoplanes italicus]|uniref:hypothetical protein n=1 Tax=Actinoplanes italicus TaxID=113567 RepID=UPI0011B1D8B9|nr:hypothetical protein [Actinoplanes italicus]